MEENFFELKYQDIQKVNEEMKTIEVKGKPYVEVNERIKAFRKLYPEGIIETELLSNENGVCVIRAKIYGHTLLATGLAYEKEGSSFINSTSYIENCETSAVGRALGMLGLGIDTSIASAEEVQNAIKNQESMKLITTKDITTFNDMIIKYDKDPEEVYKYFKIKDIREMTKEQFKEFKNICEKSSK